MIFSETFKQVLAGKKTKTRRIMKPGDFLSGGVVFNAKIHPRYTTGSTHAVQTGRTSPGLWWLPGIVQTACMPYGYFPAFNGIDEVDFENMTLVDNRPDLKKQGYVPVRIHLTSIEPDYNVREIAWSEAVQEGFGSVLSYTHTWAELHDRPMLKHWHEDVSAGYWFEQMHDRPADRYAAWVLTFCLLPDTPAAPPDHLEIGS